MTTITLDPIAQGAPMAMRCPKCAADMYRYERHGIVIDQCVDCRGIFLDRGGLERLVDAGTERAIELATDRSAAHSVGGYRSDWDAEPAHEPWEAAISRTARWSPTRAGHLDDLDEDHDHDHRRARWDRVGRHPRRQRSVLAELLDRFGD
jgi:Zn-finger nucleic acid-binding protein